MFDLTIPFGSCSTRVAVRAGCLEQAARLLIEAAGRRPPRVLLISDETVASLYADRVGRSFQAERLDFDLHVIPPGEASKSLDGLEDIYNRLAALAFPRDGVIAALGGGVVSDLAGFAAATWMRGVQFAIFPTTLEADIDAAVGGKTAVNLPAGKNLVGAFHQPVCVGIDPGCLETLPERDLRAGLAESVKHALIRSFDFLAWHEDRADRILARDAETLAVLIRRNVEIKAGIVREDAEERSGLRMLLNFGHTVGHAIETCAGYALRHGECVALGMVAACRVGERIGLTAPTLTARVAALLSRLGLPTVLESPPEAEAVMEVMRRDKKIADGKARLVLLEDAGRPIIRDDVPESLVREVYASLRA